MTEKLAYQVNFSGKVLTRVGRSVYCKCPISSVTVYDNDSATHAYVPVAADGTFKVDFELAAKDVEGLKAMLTDRLKFYWHGITTQAEVHCMPYEFLIAAGHVPVDDILEGKPASFRHNFADIEVRLEFQSKCNNKQVGLMYGASDTMKESYNRLKSAGKIKPSVFTESIKMNALIERQGAALHDKINSTCVVDERTQMFSDPTSRAQMGGEVELLVDMYGTQKARDCLHAPLVAVIYGLVTACNLNAVHVRDLVFMNTKNLFHVFNDHSSFFTICDIASGYGYDITLADCRKDCAGDDIAMVATENRFTVPKEDSESFSQPLSRPNVNGIVFSANDCEDDAGTILSIVDGCAKSGRLVRVQPHVDERQIDNALSCRLFKRFSDEDKEAIKCGLLRYANLLKRYSSVPVFGVKPTEKERGDVGADATQTSSLGTKYIEQRKRVAEMDSGAQIMVTNVLGTALGASANSVDNKVGAQTTLGGHCYCYSSLLVPDGDDYKAVAGAPLEGTARTKEMTFGDCCKHVPVAIEVPREHVKTMTQKGFKVLQTNAQGAVMQKNVSFDEFVVALETSPYMSVQQSHCRRTVPCVTIAKRHDPKLIGTKAVDDEMQEKADNNFYQHMLYVGSGIVTEKQDDGKEHLGTLLTYYDPGNPDICINNVTRAGLTQEEFDTVNRYKYDRVFEMHEPMNPTLEAEIIENWQPTYCAAPVRGDAVNDFMDNYYCISVSESALQEKDKKANMQRADMITKKFNTEQAAGKGLHSMICYPALHAAVRTVIFDKKAVEEAHKPGK